MNNFQNYFLYINICFLCVILTGCNTGKQIPKAVYANNYSALTASDLNTISPSKKTLSKEEAINTALGNNPEYISTQYKTDAAQAEYYKELSKLSPAAAVGAGIGNNASGTGISASYQICPDKVTNILSANSRVKQTQMESENYKRQLIQKVSNESNQLRKDKMTISIYEDDEKFQREMLEETIKKYKAGKASKADVLNFEAQTLEAMDKLVQANRDYKNNSYNLAATMGLTTAELPKKTKLTQLTTANNTQPIKLHDINYYLNWAINNRPDLKAQMDALKVSKYELIGAAAKLLPNINLATGNNGVYANANINLQGGSKTANIFSKYTENDIQKEELYKKWLEIIVDVKTQYEKLISSQAQRKVLTQAVQKAEYRRNLVQKKYNSGKAELTELNQAQNDYINSLNSYKKAVIDVTNAQAGLNAACGI